MKTLVGTLSERANATHQVLTEQYQRMLDYVFEVGSKAAQDVGFEIAAGEDRDPEEVRRRVKEEVDKQLASVRALLPATGPATDAAYFGRLGPSPHVFPGEPNDGGKSGDGSSKE